MEIGHPTCPECKYDLTGLGIAGTCPECGKAFDKSRLGFSTKNNEMEAKLARTRTVLLGAAAIFVLVVGLLLQLWRWRQGLATGGFISVILIMAAVWSFLTEKPEVIEPSRFDPPDSKRHKGWFGSKAPKYESPAEKYEDQWPLPKD